MFFGRCDLVLNFTQIARLSINCMQDDTFVPNLVQIGQETDEKRWREKKKKKSKPTEKYNITPDLEKCHFYKKTVI